MTLEDSVRFGNTTIDYQVRRSQRRRKTVQITVDGGGVHVAAPMTTPDSELQAIVQKRAPWILDHASKSMLEAAPKRFVSGETLPYVGRNVRILVEAADVARPDVRFDHWRFRIAVPETLSGEERYQSIRRAVIRWYRARAAERLAEICGTLVALGWATERCRGFSSAISASAGEAAPPTGRCVSIGGPSC